MSSIDQRVVEMRFDNQQFESGIKTSLSSLDKLKSGLNFDKATSALDDLSKAGSNFNMGGIADAVDNIASRFTLFGEIVQQVRSNIASFFAQIPNNIANTTLSMTALQQAGEGFTKYGNKTTAVATLRAQGYELEQVNEQLDKLNWFTDETSYNFVDMVSEIGKFTAAGQGLDESVTAMMGIANWASLSGQNAQTASRAMYQLSQAMGKGALKFDDYKSIQTFNMNTAEFQQKALDAAVALGTLKKTGTDTYRTLAGHDFSSLQFTEYLSKDAWFTSDVMMDVFTQYASAVEDIYAYTEETGKLASEAIEDLGGSLDEFGLKAFRAAQEAKTWGDVVDSVKDAVSTGWMNTWELIFGNYDEARVLWTDLANTLYDVFAESGNTRNEILAQWKELGGRDDLLDSFWNIFNSITNIVEPVKQALRDVFAFGTDEDGGITRRAERIKNLTAAIKNLTEHLKVSDEMAENIRRTFRGVASVFGIVWEAIKAVVGGFVEIIKYLLPSGSLVSNVLGFTGNIGDMIFAFHQWIKESGFFTTAVGKVVDVVKVGIDWVKEKLQVFIAWLPTAWASIKSAFGAVSDTINKYFPEIKAGLSTFFNNLKSFFSEKGDEVAETASSVWEKIGAGFTKVVEYLRKAWDTVKPYLQTLWNEIKEFATLIYQGVKGLFTNGGGFDGLKDAIDTVVDVGTFAVLKQVIDKISEFFEKGKGVFDSLAGVLENLGGVLKDYQNNLKADTLLKIAEAVGILAASILIIALIPEDKLWGSVEAIGALMAALTTMMVALNKFGSSGGLTASSSKDGILGLFGFKYESSNSSLANLIGLSVGILILAAAVKKIADLDPKAVGLGMAAITGLLIELGGTAIILNKIESKNTNMIATAITLVAFAVAITKLAGAVEQIGQMSWQDGLKGVLGVTALMLGLAAIMNSKDISVGKGVAFGAIASSMMILVKVVEMFAGIDAATFYNGILRLSAGLLELYVVLRVTPTDADKKAKAIGVLALSLIPLAAAIKLLGTMSLGQVAVALIALAGAFGVMYVAARFIGPMAISLLTMAQAFALIGVSVALVGGGLLLFAEALAIIAVVGAAAAAALLLIGAAIAELIPLLAAAVGRALVAIIQEIDSVESQLVDSFVNVALHVIKGLIVVVPDLVELLFTIVDAALKGLAEHGESIANSLFDFVVIVLEVLASRVPELVTVALGAIGEFLTKLGEALSELDPVQIAVLVGATALLVVVFKILAEAAKDAKKAAISIGLMLVTIAGVAAIFWAIRDVDGLNALEQAGAISSVMLAMAGIVQILKNVDTKGALNAIKALDIMIGNLVVVLTALGGIYQIPFMPKLINDGGKFLKDIGSAIGGFFGGIIGAFGQALSISLVRIGENIKTFGENITPFFEAMGGIKQSAIDNVGAVCNALLTLTAAELIDGIARLFGGGSGTLSRFADELIAFAPKLAEYAQTISGIGTDDVNKSLLAAQMIADFATSVPETGGLLQKITGENDLGVFGDQLAKLGPGLAEFCASITGIDTSDVESAIAAAEIVAEFADKVPETGGWVQRVTGENDIGVFGEQLASFGPNLAAFSESVSGKVDKDAIEIASDAGTMLATLAEKLPPMDGLKQTILGSKDLKSFGEQLEEFGKGIAKYSKKVSDDAFDAEAVEKSATAATMLATMADTLPDTGGAIGQWFMGKVSIEEFGSQLGDFGTAMATFSANVEGIDSSKMSIAVLAAKDLVDFANYSTDWTSTGANFATFGGHIANFGENLWTYYHWIESMNEGKLEGTTTGFSQLIDAVNKIDANAAEALSVFGEALNTLTSGEGDLSTFGDEISELGDKLQDYNEKIADLNTLKIRSSITAVQDLAEMSTTIDWNSNTNFEDFGNGIKTLGSNLNEYWNSIQSVTPSTLEAITKEIRSLVNVAKSLTSGAGSALETFGSGLKSIGEAGLDNFVSAVQNGGSKISAAATSMMTQYINAVDSKSALLKAAFTAVIREIIDDLNTKAALFTTTGMKQMDGLISGIKLKENSFKTAFTNSVQTAINALKDKTATFSEIGESYISKLTDAMKQKSQLSTSTVNSVVNAITDKFREKYTIFNAIGSTFADKMISGLGAKASDASSKAMYVASNAASNARTKYWDFYSAGEYMVTGFCNGIQANNYRAAAKARAMAQSAVTAAQNQLRIQSPSKVFYQIGDYAGQGFVNGLDDSRSSAYDASSSMADFAINGIKSAVDRINEMVNDSIDTNPVIRPTIDLTDVRTGSSALASILNDPSLMGLDGSSALAGRVGSQIDRYMSAQATDPTLTALADLKTSIDTIGAGGQTVNNTFYITGDDPQEIANEVSRILQQQVERRDAQWA